MKHHIDEVASFLNLPVNTLKRWIRQGRIPVHRNGDICIFKKDKLDEWAKKNSLSFNNKNFETGQAETGKEQRLLSRAFSDGRVFYDVDKTSKEDIFSFVVEKMDFSSKHKAEFLKRLFEREEMSSTGIGRGIAIPHPREPMEGFVEHSIINTVFLKEPVDFESIDNQKVFVLFVIVCRNVKEHLKLLSSLSYCLRHDSFIDFLRKKPDPLEIFMEIDSFEQKLEVL
ncbi:MAG: hypothetical protein CSB21_02450 [Deltaproteobacteria bacterium]|nr:MAG: hypothetical protein CSB21_02450 [Deltaproteobacteria bacterium]